MLRLRRSRITSGVRRQEFSRARQRAVAPGAEALEARTLLTTNPIPIIGQWTYDSRITYSFMPDGTNIAGSPSTLFSTLNTDTKGGNWQLQFALAASDWENVTPVNFALVSDNGAAFGSAGNQQDSPNFGDIRIGAAPLSGGILAETFDPPPSNGGTAAGDIIFNSNVQWGIGSNYDIATVAIHEFGHALGLGDESSNSTDVMYSTYVGIKDSLASDDIGAIESIYGTRLPDQFNSNGASNAVYTTATNITSYIDTNKGDSTYNQLAIPGLENMGSATNEWYFVIAPQGTSSTVSFTVQSTNLSLFAANIQVYTSKLSLVGLVTSPDKLGTTATITDTGVAAGAGFYIRVYGAGGPGQIGSYGLLANFSGNTQAPVAPPNTVVPEQPDGSGGISDDLAPTGNKGGKDISQLLDSWELSIGSINAWSQGMNSMPTTVNPFTWLVNHASSTASLINQNLDTLILGALDSVLADWNASQKKS